MANGELTLRFSSAPSSLLDSDPNNGLRVGIEACAQAWKHMVVRPPSTAFGYRCAQGATAVTIDGAPTASVAALERAPSVLADLRGPAAKHFLMLTLTLPAGAPGDISQVPACSGVPGGTSATEDMQGCSSTLTYTFQAAQR